MKQEFKPEEWLAPKTEQNGVVTDSKVLTNGTSTEVPVNAGWIKRQVAAVVEQLTAENINIAEDYNDWLRIGFALSNQLGEEGRDFFHKISRMSTKYDYNECNKKYDNCLATNDGRTTISTFFWMAGKAGIDTVKVAMDTMEITDFPMPEEPPDTPPSQFCQFTDEDSCYICETTDDEQQIINNEVDMLSTIEESRMSFEHPVDPPVYVLSVDGCGFFSKGDVHAVKAMQKAGKTSALTVMAAALLSGKCFRLKSEVEDARILWVDTEQNKSDTYANYDKVFDLAGLEKQDIHERFELYSLRKNTIEEKIKAINELLEKNHPDVVFIDGLVDLIKNFNEVEESQSLMANLMQKSAQYNCAIVCILHTNKSADDHNMRGHLGTMLAQRAGNVLECKKDKATGVITVSSADSRHVDVPAWRFRYDESGRIVQADDYNTLAAANRKEDAARRREAERQQTKTSRYNCVREILNNNGNSMLRKELKQAVMGGLNLQDTVVKGLIKNMIDEGKLIVNDKTVSLPVENE